MSWQDPDSLFVTEPTRNVPSMQGFTGGLSGFSDLFPGTVKNVQFYIITVLYLIILFLSSFINFVFFILLFLSTKQFRERAFVRLLWSVIMANFLTCLSNIVITVPLTFLEFTENELASFQLSFTYAVFKFMRAFAVELNLIFTLVIAIQRLLVFFSQRLTMLLFEGFIFYIVVLTAWLFTFFAVFTLNYYKCITSWIHEKKMFKFGCYLSPNVHSNVTPIAEVLITVQNIAIPIVVLICYIVIFFHIHAQRRFSDTSMTFEIEILKQAFLTFILFEVSSLYSLMIPAKAINQETAFTVNRVDMILNLLSGALTPVLFMITSSEIRSQLRWLMLIKPKIGVKVVSRKDPPRPGITASSAAPPYRFARNNTR